jgi:lipoprotein-anchoring transpeptidase ErfK/SrfK
VRHAVRVAFAGAAAIAAVVLFAAPGTGATRFSTEMVSASDAARVTFPHGRRARIALPDGSSREIVSLLRVDRAMRYGEFRWSDVSRAGPIWVRVDLAHELISVFRGGDEIGTALVLFGTDGKPTPTGVFPVLSKSKQHRSTQYDAEMPYALWLTRNGVAIHASQVRYGTATHGCIGVPLAFAEHLFNVISPRDLVVILPDRNAAKGRNRS